MSINNIFGVAGSALNAQLVRLNLTASNIANASTVATTEGEAYKAKRPVFATILNQEQANQSNGNTGGVKIDQIIDDKTGAEKVFDPTHPKADVNGYLYRSNVNEIAEMVEMMAAARSYQNNVEVINTAKDLATRTIDTMKS